MRKAGLIIGSLLTGILLSAPTQGQEGEEPVLDTIIVEVPAVDTLQEVQPTVLEGESLSRYLIPKSIYQSGQSDTDWRKIPADTLKRFREDPDYWYANYDFSEAPPPVRKRWLDYRWVINLIWFGILFAFIGLLVWFLWQNGFGVFKKDSPVVTGGEAGAEETEDIFSIAYDTQIQKAERDGNYRLAIRFHFLRLICQLALKNDIQYKPDRTNLDYLMQLQGKKEYASFFEATRYFEYTWYGNVSPDEERYQPIRQFFQQLTQKGGAA